MGSIVRAGIDAAGLGMVDAQIAVLEGELFRE